MSENVSWNEIKSSTAIDIIASKEQLKTILKDIDNDVDKDGFVIDSQTQQKVMSKDEDDIRIGQIGVIASGSKIFIKNNIASFSEYLIEKMR